MADGPQSLPTLAVRPRKIRPIIFSFGDLYQLIKEACLPKWMHEVLYWKCPALSSLYLVASIALIGFLSAYSAVKVFSVLMFVLLFEVMMYSFVRLFIRFRPLEQILGANLQVHPEPVLAFVRGAVNFYNRAVATGQYLIFCGNICVSIGLWLLLVEMHRYVAGVNPLTVCLLALILAFSVPKMLDDIITRLRTSWIEATRPENRSTYPIFGTISRFMDMFEVAPMTAPEYRLFQAGTRQYASPRGPTGSPIQMMQQRINVQISLGLAPGARDEPDEPPAQNIAAEPEELPELQGVNEGASHGPRVRPPRAEEAEADAYESADEFDAAATLVAQAVEAPSAPIAVVPATRIGIRK
ncbi:uncharacterized protein LOC115627909 [Scaptodrosophila lebanonensis]|uniref:Reticulon-like protein n=1 Tax=Drosophila lebanonensis TaxID=7225 RepID=A0A6J2TUA3_DROLE|nr:uncharacterized protein LOC115627909 [Scaptodrosophila lebanonensis]